LSHIFADGKKNKKNICKTYTLPPHRRLRKLNGRDSESGLNSGGDRVSGGGRDTMRPAADATWRPEMNYHRFRVRQLRVVVLVDVGLEYVGHDVYGRRRP